MKRTIIFGLLLFLAAGLFAQNETSRDFLNGTSLARQEGSSLDKFPKLEIGFIGRPAADTREASAFLFLRLQATLEVGGGVISGVFKRDGSAYEGNTIDQFVTFLATAYTAGKRAADNGDLLDFDVGEIELIDFQWYMTENQWKYTRNKTIRIKMKLQTVGRENRLYFYRTSSVKDYRNEFETFTMPNDCFLTMDQCFRIADAAGKPNSFFNQAIQIAIGSVTRTIR